MATLRGFLGDTPYYNLLRFKRLRRRKLFIYFIYTIKCIIGAYMADANAPLYTPIRRKNRVRAYA